MKQTAIEWLVEQILVEVNKYDEDGNINGKALWNAYIGSVDLSEYVAKAKKIEKRQLSEYLNELSRNINRVEVIQHSPPYNGRAYTNREAKHVEISLQDNNETLKIFLV
jgi:hypothetical protein